MIRALIAALLICATGAGAASADPTYPNRTVRFVVPFLAGGAPDVLARMLAQRLSARLGQQFIVENQGGIGGSLGASNVAKSAPDGYTLFFASEAPLVINPHIYASPLGYETLRDFAPVTGLVRTAFYVVTCPNVQATSLQGLAEVGRTKNLTYASTGFGTTMNLAGEMLKRKLNFNMTHVPYKGVPPAMADIVACNVDVGFGAYNSALPLIKSGRVKGLAVSTPTRMAETPDIPTLREQGFAELEQIESSFSVLAPAKTPRPIIDLLHKEILAIMSTDEMKAEVGKRGMFLMLSQKPEDFADWIRDASKRYKQIVTEAKIRIE